eukprot:137574_1
MEVPRLQKLRKRTRSNVHLRKADLNLGVIGNCNFSALIDKHGKIVWCCLPRFDSNPIFSVLLAGNDPRVNTFGFFDVVIDDFLRCEQKYVKNTAVLETRLFDTDGNILRITDFAPRFTLFERLFCPSQFIRIITPERGNPRIAVRCRPSDDYHSRRCEQVVGTNHISFRSCDYNARLTTNVPVPFVHNEIMFVATKEYHMFFGLDETITGGLKNMAHDWKNNSGAILAAMTTSIPESAHSGRCWDYRFCWLRDSFHTVQALNRLGCTDTMERYLEFIVNIVSVAENDAQDLQPLYGLLLESNLVESEVTTLNGYRDMGPVRIGNSAYTQAQNDNYGSVILSVMQVFFDERLVNRSPLPLFEKLERLGEIAVEKWNVPDAGLWEFRGSSSVHTFSSSMCWAACDRLAKIAQRLGLGDREEFWKVEAKKIRTSVLERAWDSDRRCFVATLSNPEEGNGKEERPLDASVLLLPQLQIISANDERFVSTVEAVGNRLVKDGMVFRYIIEDDFGFPDNSFIVCTFWYIQALAMIGRKQEAREMFENLLQHRNHVGLFSEDINIKTKELWGNYPQTYSLVGVINTAILLSAEWTS